MLRLVEDRGTIGGRFQNVRRVDAAGGGGCFSLVFEADDTCDGTTVAVKVYHPDERVDAYRWACFRREAQVLGRLIGEPDIIQCLAPQDEFIVALPTTAGISFNIAFAYYVIERAETDLGALILNESLSAEQCLLAFRCMCRGVQRIHSRGITHRDIKPSNFLVMRDRQLKLSDFGTARDLAVDPPILPVYDFPPGDIRYQAPELLAGLHDEDPSLAFDGDIFALGASLFELFTGSALSLELNDPTFATDLMRLNAVRRPHRKRIYDEILPSICAGHALPSVGQFGTRVPGAIRPLIDRLYREMASLDYRVRLRDFTRIFRQIDICLLILRNQAIYDKWRNEKLRRRNGSR